MSDDKTTLLDLPEHVLVDILGWLHDVYDVCSAARTCKLLLRLSSSPALWSHHKPGGPVIRAAQQLLSSILHLPPQAFHVHIDPHVSRTFPINVPLNNLRGILGCNDATHLAEQLSSSIQEVLASLKPHQRLIHANRPLAPQYAVFGVCRADFGQVRLSLNHPVAVPLLLQHIACMPGAATSHVEGTQTQGITQVQQRAVHAVRQLLSNDRKPSHSTSACVPATSHDTHGEVACASRSLQLPPTADGSFVPSVHTVASRFPHRLKDWSSHGGHLLLSSDVAVIAKLEGRVHDMLSSLFPANYNSIVGHLAVVCFTHAAIQQAVIHHVIAKLGTNGGDTIDHKINSPSNARMQPRSHELNGSLSAALLAETCKAARLDDALLCCTHLEKFVTHLVGVVQSHTQGTVVPGALNPPSALSQGRASQLTSLSLNELVFRHEQTRGPWDPRTQSQRTIPVSTCNPKGEDATATTPAMAPETAKNFIARLFEHLNGLQRAVFDVILAPATPSKSSLGLLGLGVRPPPEQECEAMLQGLTDAAKQYANLAQQHSNDTFPCNEQVQPPAGVVYDALPRGGVLNNVASSAVTQGVGVSSRDVQQHSSDDTPSTGAEMYKHPVNQWEPDPQRALLRWCLLLAFTKCTNWYLHILGLDDLLA